VITATNLSILSPKLRYNVGDEAFVMPRNDLLDRLVALSVIDSKKATLSLGWASPFLFLFGRRDSTISYMGANIYPIDVEYGLYRNERIAAGIESFCIQLEEQSDLESRPVVHVQLRPTVALDMGERERVAAGLRSGLIDHLRSASRDFAEAVREDPAATDVRVLLHDHGTGPFAGGSTKLKNVYVLERKPG
jgi:phenylacetate-CoA ligase